MNYRPSIFTRRQRCGFTIVEVMIAALISILVAVSLMTATIMISGIAKSIRSQQRFSMNGKKAIETINREIRLAQSPIRVLADDGSAVLRGNRVSYAHEGESPGTREIFIAPGDNDFNTPWDNTLMLDPDTSVSDNEVEIIGELSPINLAGAFRYRDARTPLTVQIRVGDPTDEDGDGVFDNTDTHQSDRMSGAKLQGFEINITVAPRN